VLNSFLNSEMSRNGPCLRMLNDVCILILAMPRVELST
jgi:hypothetical protein